MHMRVTSRLLIPSVVTSLLIIGFGQAGGSPTLPLHRRVHAGSGTSPMTLLASTGPPAESGGWTLLGGQDLLTNAQFSYEHGTATSAGICVFRISGTLTAGAAPMEQQLVAYQPATCYAQIEEGTPPGSTSASSSPETSAAPSVGGAHISETGWVHGWTTDPVGLDLNGFVNYASWTSNGSCITGASEGYTWGDFGVDGWGLILNQRTQGWRCGQVWSTETAGAFQNALFCGGFATESVYEPLLLHGFPAGNLTYQGCIAEDGLCADLLTPHVTAGFGNHPGW